MKNLLKIIMLFGIILQGCSENLDMNSPVENPKPEANLLVLPAANGMQVNKEWTVSEKINGAQGGSLSNYVSYYGGAFGKVTIDANIEFTNGAWPGKETISMTLSSENTSVAFGPSMTFNRTVLFNITYKGLDLNGINTSKLKFVYLAEDGSIEVAACDAIVADASIGKLQVVNAVIPHFSRYGFVN